MINCLLSAHQTVPLFNSKKNRHWLLPLGHHWPSAFSKPRLLWAGYVTFFIQPAILIPLVIAQELKNLKESVLLAHQLSKNLLPMDSFRARNDRDLKRLSMKIFFSYQIWLITGLVITSSLSGCTGIGLVTDSGGSQVKFRKDLFDEELNQNPQSTRDPSSSLAQYNFLRAELALAHEEYDEAIRFYEAAIKYDPAASVTFRKRLAQLYFRANRFQEALRQLDLAQQQLEPDDNENMIALLELRAGALIGLKQNDEATRVYKDLIKHTPPDNIEPYLLLTSLYTQVGNLAEAKNTLRQLIQASPTAGVGYYYFARIEEAQGELQEAESSYRKARKLSPNPETVDLDIARVLGALRRYQEALALCNQLLKSSPENLAAWRLKAQILLRENKFDDALHEFEALATQETDPTETQFRIGLIELERKNFQRAAEKFTPILEKHPENEIVRYYLASAYAGLGRNDEALAELQKIDAKDKMYTEAKTLTAYLLQQQKKYKEAIEALQTALNAKANDTKLLTFIAMLHREAGEMDQAVSIMEKVTQLEPQKDEHYFTLGVFYDDQQKKSEAITAIKKAVELNPQNAVALNYLGYAYAEVGEHLDQAEKLVRQALAIDKNNGYYVDSLGWIYFKMARYQEALKQLKKAAQLTPNDAAILEHLGHTYQKLGKRKEAYATFEKALGHASSSDDKKIESRLRGIIQEIDTKKSSVSK